MHKFWGPNYHASLKIPKRAFAKDLYFHREFDHQCMPHMFTTLSELTSNSLSFITLQAVERLDLRSIPVLTGSVIASLWRLNAFVINDCECLLYLCTSYHRVYVMSIGYSRLAIEGLTRLGLTLMQVDVGIYGTILYPFINHYIVFGIYFPLSRLSFNPVNLNLTFHVVRDKI